MLNTKIKVCGMTVAEQAASVSMLGVDAIGMILFADSPRCISLDQAKCIRQVVPATVKLVGVFVNAPRDFIETAIASAGLDLVQLHGEESNEYGLSLSKPFIKAIRAKSKEQVQQEIANYADAEAILLDPYVEGLHGGTGCVLDLSMWPSELEGRGILAGGLSPDNLAQRLAELNPAMVDLNSGVESSAGQKDLELVEKAVRIARSI